jgi:hypothetical protein
VSALGGTTYATGLTGTSTVIPNSSFTSYGSYPIQVVAIAGTTYSVSAGATLRYTPAPPDDIVVNYLSTQGCQLSWAPDPFSNTVSYSIRELTGARFSVVQGPTFNSDSGLWFAGVSFGSAQVYDFFISGSTAGITGSTSEIVVYVPPITEPVSNFYGRGTYTVTVPRGFSGFEAQLVGGGGGGGGFHRLAGAAGGFCLGSISAQAGATFALVVGAGGSQSGGSYNLSAGGVGGTSSISTLIALGGNGGDYSGAAGGLASGGVVNISGGSANAYSTQGISGLNILGQNRGSGGNPSTTWAAASSPGQDGCALITFF